MPPKALRCAYREGSRRCPRNGTGNPPLCQAHREIFEDQPASSDRSALGDLLQRIVTGKRVTDRDIKSAIGEVVKVFNRGPETPPSVARGPGSQGHYEPPEWAAQTKQDARQRDYAKQQARQAVDAIAAKKKKAMVEARRALGITGNAKLTKEFLDKRRRELARKHHPDRGGSTAKMQEVNQAVDFLLQTVDN